MLKRSNKKILIIAPQFSIHTKRWLDQILDIGWEIHLYPSYYNEQLNCELNNIVYHNNFYFQSYINPGVKYRSINGFWHRPIKNRKLARLLGGIYRYFDAESDFQTGLKKVIKKVKPKIVHTMDTQNSAYPFIEFLEKNPTQKGTFFWLHTLWGSDLYFFSIFPEHLQKIKFCYKHINHLIVEGNRDIVLAKETGFNGQISVIQATGGIKLKTNHKNSTKPSSRKSILIKGRQGLVQRGLIILRALEKCEDLLRNYEIHVISADENMQLLCRRLNLISKLNFKVENNLFHEQVIELMANSRISISLSISDGLPNTLLESMANGTFPIQSNTSIGNEIINNGVNGILVHPMDIEDVENAIRTSLTNDLLVDNAQSINRKIIEESYTWEKIRNKTVKLYSDIINE